MRGSVRPVLTGGFAVTVAQVSASSKELVIAVFSSAAGHRKFCRRAVVQGRVRSMVVVVLRPAFELTPCIGQGEKDLHVQALVPPLAVEAFDSFIRDETTS